MIIFLHTFLTWLELVGIALAFGLLLFRLPASGQAGRPALRWPVTKPVLGAAIVLTALAGGAGLLLSVSGMSGTPGSPGLAGLLWETRFGILWLARMACLLLVLGLLLPGRTGSSFPTHWLILALMTIVALTETATRTAGHGGHPAVREFVDGIHFLSASIWSGGVLALVFFVLPSYRWQGDMVRIATATRWFSRVAGYCVVLVLVTSLYHVYAYVGSFTDLWRTTYGLTVLVKMVLLYFVLLIGALNRYFGVPLLEHAAGGRFEGRGLVMQLIDRVLVHARGHLAPFVISLFRRVVTLEAVLMLALLLCSALLAQRTPPRDVRGTHEERKDETVAPQPPVPALPTGGERTAP